MSGIKTASKPWRVVTRAKRLKRDAYGVIAVDGYGLDVLAPPMVSDAEHQKTLNRIACAVNAHDALVAIAEIVVGSGVMDLETTAQARAALALAKGESA